MFSLFLLMAAPPSVSLKPAVVWETSALLKPHVKALFGHLAPGEATAKLLRENLEVEEAFADAVQKCLDKSLDNAVDMLCDKLAEMAAEKTLGLIEKRLGWLNAALRGQSPRANRDPVVRAWSVRPTIQPMMTVVTPKVVLRPRRYVILPAYCLNQKAKPPRLSDVLQMVLDEIEVLGGDGGPMSLANAVKKGLITVRGSGTASGVILDSNAKVELEIVVKQPSLLAVDQRTGREAIPLAKETDLFRAIADGEAALIKARRGTGQFRGASQWAIWGVKAKSMTVEKAIRLLGQVRDALLTGS